MTAQRIGAVLEALEKSVRMRTAPAARRCQRILMGMGLLQPPPRYQFASVRVPLGPSGVPFEGMFVARYDLGMLLCRTGQPPHCGRRGAGTCSECWLAELASIAASEPYFLAIEGELLSPERPDPVKLSRPLKLDELPGFAPAFEEVLRESAKITCPSSGPQAEAGCELRLARLLDELARPFRKEQGASVEDMFSTAYLEVLL